MQKHRYKDNKDSISKMLSGPVIKASNISESGNPSQSKVNINIKYIINKNIGIPRYTICYNLDPIFPLRELYERLLHYVSLFQANLSINFRPFVDKYIAR